MNKRHLLAAFLLTAGLCYPLANADAKTAATTDVVANDATQVSTLAALNEIKAAVQDNETGGYTAEEVLELWHTLQPELVDEIINIYGRDNVLAAIDAVLQYINNGTLPPDIPNIPIPDKYVKEFKLFVGQVMPLYTYLMKDRTTPPSVSSGMFDVKNVYNTPKDGCFYGIGDERNTYDPKGIDCEECKTNGGKPKANGSYVWGMVSDGEKLYWSTNNNYLCMPGYGQIATGGSSGTVENSCWVCEYQKGQRAEELAEIDQSLAKYGDIIPPRIFSYDPRTGVVKDITPEPTNVTDTNPLQFSQGLRSAAYHNGVVFFGGPNFTGADAQQSSSATFLAYSPEKGEFIGKSSLSSVSGCTITNVRRWIVINGVLYCGVGLIKDGVAGGGIMRWNGSVDDPFNFEIVGYTPAEAAEIEYHNGHIYVGGWPVAKFGQTATAASALYKSPEIPTGGFTAENATEWPKVWEYTSYETSPTALGSTYFSVMKSFKGRLYWGMFSGTYATIYTALRRFGTLASAEAIAYALGSMRATTLFSAEDLDGDNSKVTMLYGESQLPVYDSQTGLWSIEDNGSSYKPVWGRSGYGNLFTCYTWAMAKYNDKLFVGTMDMSDLIDPALEGSLADGTNDNQEETKRFLGIIKKLFNVDSSKYGYECLMISDQDTEPEYVTDNGFGNPAAYGIRNMEVCDGKMFIGTANPLNLHEQGGWQIMSVEEEGSATSVGKQAVKKAGVMFKQNEHYLEFSSMTGEKIQKVTLTDMSGKVVAGGNYGRTLATVVTDGIAKGIYVATIKTDTDSYSTKLTIK